jgi:RNA polymerase sigma factor (sigma-70 family)
MGAASPGELVRRARAGDEAAWAALTERYSGMLWAIARAYGLGPADAADVVQLAWLRLVEHIGALRRPERVGAWLAVTARREAARTLRHRGRSGELPPEALPDPATPDTVLAGRERLRAVLEAIGALPGLCRQMLRLLATSPTYAEVSAALDIPVGSVGPARARCLASLRKRLEGSA